MKFSIQLPFKLSTSEIVVLSFILVSLLAAFVLQHTEQHTVFQLAAPNTQLIHMHTDYPTKASWSEVHTRVVLDHRSGLSLLDAWFTSVSALCVTGLTVNDFSHFSHHGQLLVLLLIQAGGLGIFVFTSLLAVSIFRGLQYHASFQDLLASTVDSDRHDALDILYYIFCFTLFFEAFGIIGLGSYLTWFAEDPPIGDTNPWWWATFHTVSAFNNAGFSLMPDSLTAFSQDLTVNLIITTLIIFGGIGYPVLLAGLLWGKRGFTSSISTEDTSEIELKGVASSGQIKSAIYGTIILLTTSTALLYFQEFDNTMVMGSESDTFLLAWFQSVTTRTAGFNTVAIGEVHAQTLVLMMILMFIGANPGGTAGGLKIPTFNILAAYIIDWFNQPGRPLHMYGRPVSHFSLTHAVRLFFFGTLFLVFIATFIMYLEREWIRTNDPTFSLTKVFFEVVSAFSTTGLSMGYAEGNASFSALLSAPSKLLLIITMFFGRIGPLVILSALPWKRRFANYPPSPDVPGGQKIQIG